MDNKEKIEAIKVNDKAKKVNVSKLTASIDKKKKQIDKPLSK